MLKVENLCASYKNNKVFSNLNFEIKDCEITALCGMNGSGKSTALSLLAGIVPEGLKVDGRVLMNEKKLLECKAKTNAKNISYLVQNEFNIWNITVEQLVSDGRFIHHKWYEDYESCDKNLIQETLKLLALYELKDRNIKSISGGEFQRARIARSLVQETDIIIMDEPLTALDINHQKELMSILKELCKKGKTIILSIHDINIAAIYADKIALMKKDRNGIIIGCEKEVLTKENLLEVYGTNFQIYNHPITGAVQIF